MIYYVAVTTFYIHSEQDFLHCRSGNGVNKKRTPSSHRTVKMANANGIRRHHFWVKTYEKEIGIKEVLDRMHNKEFSEVSFTGSKNKIEML